MTPSEYVKIESNYDRMEDEVHQWVNRYQGIMMDYGMSVELIKEILWFRIDPQNNLKTCLMWRLDVCLSNVNLLELNGHNYVRDLWHQF